MDSFRIDRRRIVAASGLGAVWPQVLRAQLAQTGGQDLVVLIPGITGSVLSVRGSEVWSPTTQGVVSALFTLGSNMRPLTLQSDPIEQIDLDDGVQATRIVQDAHLIPGLWKIDGYTKLSQHLESLAGIRKNENFFEFPYDWRRDNRVSARRLQMMTHAWLRDWRTKSGNPNAKIVFIAHSMGGLIARYFVECMEGWQSTRRLITFGTPFRGSLNALKFLHEGIGESLSRLGLIDLSALIRSFTSVYQLLPTYPCIEDGTKGLRRVSEVGGIANLNAAKVSDALAFHRSIEEAVSSNRKLANYKASGYQLHPVVGVSQKTLLRARKEGRSLAFLTILPDTGDSATNGDGTVPRPSATPIELQGLNSEMFVSASHGSLQNADAVIIQVGSLITAKLIEWDQYRAVGLKTSLKVPDAVGSSERIQVTGSIDPVEYVEEVVVQLADVYSGQILARTSANADATGAYSTVLGPVPPGTYRVSVRLTRRLIPEVHTLTDILCVIARM